ncbi:hypothetical protein [Polyangium mundeleinium]|uniref:Tryptophan synthase alpha chain n=1 Tax=Polyangium mundeleinium TaxID=2995306 RepID=A0ABT5EKS8_9BACT|nr:hypothetical protein [Polyangium mundeleinium]MDC0742457.1 hypothetical protein [Polyangium mundeleinium]
MLRFDRLFGLGVAGLVFAAACGGGGEGSSASASGGGSEPVCTSDAQCSASAPCKIAACVAGACVETQAPEGKLVLDGLVSGDCKRKQCKADGTIEEVVDDTDNPEDYNPCTLDTCTAGMPSHTPDLAMETMPCGASSATTCSAGVCIGCTEPSQCPQGGVCHVAVCNPMGMTNACDLVFDVGKAVANEDPGDCLQAVCDMNGLVVPAPAPLDVPPPDDNECDVESCGETGAIVHTPQVDDTACGGSTTCKPSSCSAGVCVTQMPLPGTEVVLETQVPGDCRSTVCDGMGGTLDQPDDADVPTDPTPGDCTIPVCSGGTPSTGPAVQGTPCMNAGGALSMCDASGSCI